MERVSEETKGSVKKRRAVGVFPNHPILFACSRKGFFTSGYQRDHTQRVNIRDHTQRVKTRDHTQRVKTRDHTQRVNTRDHTQRVNVRDLTQRFNAREHTQRINIRDHTQLDHTQRDDLTDRIERDKQIPHEHTGFNESINGSHRNSTNFFTHNVVLDDDVTSDVLINEPPCSEMNAAHAEYMQIYDTVRSSGKYNYQQCRIPLPQPLHISAWRKRLHAYHDNIICDYLEFGWPIGFISDTRPSTIQSNHASAYSYPDHIHHYVNTELQHGAILGPFSQPPFEHFHTSPLMTRPKKNSGKRRVIMDFSFPHGHSVNDGIARERYLGEDYKLRYPTVDDFAALILSKGKGCHMYKVDISRAYRHFRADPSDIDMLGFSYDGLFYTDTSIGFGLRTGAMICQRVTNSVRYMMMQYGNEIENYIDDMVGADTPSEATPAFIRIRSLLAELGITEAREKACPPSTKMDFIGITFDSIALTMSIPIEKIEDILSELRFWSTKPTATKSQLSSILGKLHFISKCVRPARLFVSRMLETLRAAPDTGYIRISDEFKKDVHWFLNFMPTYNGINMMVHSPLPSDMHVELDACMTGVGGRCGDEVYHCTIPPFIVDENHHITHLEMLNLVIAAKLWKSKWQGHRITIHCDNIACVYTLNTGRARDPYLLKCAREIWLISATHDFVITACHKRGADNVIADTLSRSHLSEQFKARLDTIIKQLALNVILVDESLFKLIESI